MHKMDQDDDAENYESADFQLKPHTKYTRPPIVSKSDKYEEENDQEVHLDVKNENGNENENDDGRESFDRKSDDHQRTPSQSSLLNNYTPAAENQEQKDSQ